jgi:hypothetical protein
MPLPTSPLEYNPTPAATLSPAAAGIGVSREEMLELFGQEKSGFEMQFVAEVGRYARQVRTFWQGKMIVELIRPKQELVQASLYVDLEEENQGLSMVQGLYTVAFLQRALPGWEDAGNWLMDSLVAAAEQREVRAQKGDIQLTLHVSEDGDSFVLIVSGRK